MTYKSGEDVRTAVWRVMRQEDFTLVKLAEKMGTVHSNLSRSLNRLNPSFNAIRDIADAMGYKLVFDIVPKSASEYVKEE